MVRLIAAAEAPQSVITAITEAVERLQGGCSRAQAVVSSLADGRTRMCVCVCVNASSAVGNRREKCSDGDTFT